MGQAASHALVAAADLQPPLTMGVSGVEEELGESPQHIKMLSSNRFTKTILCKHATEGQMVLHVFMRPVSMTFNLGPQIRELQRVYKQLKDARHVLWRTLVVSDERAVYTLRQYLHNNLYDRISTRPFLSLTEKRWIAYQILVGLKDVHKRGVCHGDIKNENIVMTSWNLLYLADFAPFKPAYLPADDPAEFNFYFDTTSRQCCCVAPERFYDAGSRISQKLTAGEEVSLQSSMDIFSAGCIIGELFLDGNPLFSLSRLLQYRRGLVKPAAVVEDIPDSEMAELVQHMIQLEPSTRLSAEEYLDRWSAAFPKVPLAAYMDQDTADSRMRALAEEVEVNDSSIAPKVVASVACAAVRNCREPSARSQGIRVLKRCCLVSESMGDDADLILPQLVTLASDPSARVRLEAVVAIGEAMSSMQRIAPINTNIFEDYISPQLQHVAGDPSVLVRSMVAATVAGIAESASRLLVKEDPQLSTVVTHLSFDEAVDVKHVLLCAFPQLYALNLQRLSHVITYLNERECWSLRAAFFDVVFAAAAELSGHALREYVVPLVNVGDAEAFVGASALRALIRLTPQLPSAALWDKLVEVRSQSNRWPKVLRDAAQKLATEAARVTRLPVPEHAVLTALDMTVKESRSAQLTTTAATIASGSPERNIQVCSIGAAPHTVFLTPIRNPWSTKKDEDNNDAFLRRKAVELGSLADDPMSSSDGSGTTRNNVTDTWKPQGTLVAETVAHYTVPLKCMVAGSAGKIYTGGADGTVRMFSISDVGRAAAWRARVTYTQCSSGGGHITALAFDSDCVASSTDTGSIHIWRVEKGDSVKVLTSVQLDGDEYAVALGFVRGLHGLAVVAATSHSKVLFLGAEDMQIQDSVSISPELGRLTSMTIGSSNAYVAVGTSSGVVSLVDARFRISLKTYRHPQSLAITALSTPSTSTLRNHVLVATSAGDLCLLNLRTAKWPLCVSARSLSDVKLPSAANSLSPRLRVNTVAMMPRSGCLVAGSSDALLRLWDLERPDRSYLVGGSKPGPPFASSKIGGSVYYCETVNAATSKSDVGGPVTALAIVESSSRSSSQQQQQQQQQQPMLVVGLQSGAIRVYI